MKNVVRSSWYRATKIGLSALISALIIWAVVFA